MTRAVNIAQSGANNVTMRNRIINGAMMIDQRNAGASVTPADNSFVLDRFQFSLSQSSKLTAQQSTTAPAGFSNSLLITSSSAYSVGAGDYFTVRQNIEGFNTADLSWGTASASTVTLSFWVRSSLTGTFGGSLTNNGYTRAYPFTYVINSANTWEQKTITVAGDTSGTWIGATNGVGIRVNFSLGTGATYAGNAGAWASATNYGGATGQTNLVGTSGATFYITGVQLEAGTTATPFEQRLYGTELALCQRYLPAFSGSGYVCLGMMANNTTSCYGFFPFVVSPRVTPTGITVSSLAHFKGNGVLTDLTSLSGISITAGSSVANGVMIALTGTGGTPNQFTSPYSVSASGQLLFTGCEL